MYSWTLTITKQVLCPLSSSLKFCFESSVRISQMCSEAGSACSPTGCCISGGEPFQATSDAFGSDAVLVCRAT